MRELDFQATRNKSRYAEEWLMAAYPGFLLAWPLAWLLAFLVGCSVCFLHSFLPSFLPFLLLSLPA